MSKITYPSQKDVQYLYSKYSTIENINILYKTLIKILDPSFLSTLNYENVHDAYNKVFLKYYPNEICVKSNFINKILMKGQDHITIFELPIGSSRADLCKVNGKSIAYEIKTDLDNYLRLKKQLNDYFEIFDEVYVICSEDNVKEISSIIPTNCGIYSYVVTKRGVYHFSLVREATSDNSLINSPKQLQLLRRGEYSMYFDLSSCEDCKTASNVIHYILEKYDSKTINNIFKLILKERYKVRWNFLKCNLENIYEIDYQWFFKNHVNPDIIYQRISQNH